MSLPTLEGLPNKRIEPSDTSIFFPSAPALGLLFLLFNFFFPPLLDSTSRSTVPSTRLSRHGALVPERAVKAFRTVVVVIPARTLVLGQRTQHVGVNDPASSERERETQTGRAIPYPIRPFVDLSL